MKIRILIIITLIIIGAVLIFSFTNKTLFKSYYEVTNSKGEKVKIPLPLFSYYYGKESIKNYHNITFYTIRSTENISKILNKYVENLPSCYDEGYFYDSNIDISIMRYNIEDKSPFNKINLTYVVGNQCENEYVLDNNWITDVINNATIQDAVIDKWVTEDGNLKSYTKDININNVKNILTNFSLSSAKRIENKDNIDMNQHNGYINYIISIYYLLDNNGYMLTIFNYNNALAFDVVDANDHPKNAIYEVNNINHMLENIYNSY